MAEAASKSSSDALSPVQEEGGDSSHATFPEEHGRGEKLLQDVASVVERCKQLQETAVGYSGRLKTESDALGQQAISLEKEIKQLKKDLSEAADKDEITSTVAEELDEELYRARGMVYEGDVAALLPHKANGFFLSLFLGNVNVRAARRDVRFVVKEEYNNYRDRTAVHFLVWPIGLILLKDRLWSGCFPGIPVHAYQAWLLYFYTSLALRENILRINGSDIRPWWIQHHYYAMFMSIVSLTWGIEGPDCERKQRGVGLFLWWAIMQGVAMLLQNRYQRQRLYTRIALGKAGRMDVVGGETAGVKGQLWLLYPVLFVLQGFQLYIGTEFITSYFALAPDWQAIVCGVLLIIMAVGNFINTVGTLVTKARFKAKMRRKGHQMLVRMGSRPLPPKKEQ